MFRKKKTLLGIECFFSYDISVLQRNLEKDFSTQRDEAQMVEFQVSVGAIFGAVVLLIF